jgi:hypothetical protein
MNVGFLDMDGVVIHALSSRRAWVDPVEYPSEIDSACVERLLVFQEKYNLTFVISSSIRKLHKTFEDLCEKYKGAGFEKLNVHEDWKTPHYTKPQVGTPESLLHWCKIMGDPVTEESTQNYRGHEIKAWLDAHPQTQKFLAIDDSPDFYPLEVSNCLWIRKGLATGGIGFYNPSLVDKTFEDVFGQSK